MRRGSLLILLVAALSPHQLESQDTTKAIRPARHPVTVSWQLHNKRMLALADSMPADAFTSRLSPTVKSFDELIGHTVETNYGVCAGTRKVTNPKKDAKIEGSVVTKTELIVLLRESHQYCDSLFSILKAGDMANSDLTFLPSHTGQMGALMEVYVLSRGATLANSEAGRRKASTP